MAEVVQQEYELVGVACLYPRGNVANPLIPKSTTVTAPRIKTEDTQEIFPECYIISERHPPQNAHTIS
jgi:hypothetical protein